MIHCHLLPFKILMSAIRFGLKWVKMVEAGGFTTRPVVMGKSYAITSGHYLATTAGLSVIERGGNAIDASACMAFCLAVLEPHLNSIGGEVPVLIHSAKDESVIAISGQGYAPKNATIEKFKELGIGLIPGDGLLAAAVPSIVSTWIESDSCLSGVLLSCCPDPP